MNPPPIHPMLERAANWNMWCACFNFMLFCLSGLISFVTMGMPWGDPRIDRAFVTLHLIGLAAPAITQAACEAPIRKARKTAVTLSLVFCSINLLPYLFMFFAAITEVLPSQRAGGMVIISIASMAIVSLVANIIDLARCQRIIRDLNLSGGHGFQPIMPVKVQAIPDPPPAMNDPSNPTES